MSGTQKTKAAAAPVAPVSNDAQDEIDQIMSEIEQLQQEIDSGTGAASQAPKLTVVSAVDDPQAAADAVVAEAAAAMEARSTLEGVTEGSPETLDEHEDALSEFRAAGGDEASLDDLSDLKDDGQGGSGLLDQVETEAGAASPESAEQDGFDEQEMEHIASFGPVVEQNFGTGATARQETEMENRKTGPMGRGAGQSSASTNEGSLTMNLTGNMSLKLRYEFEGQEVTIGFVDQFLQVILADGTEFKVPVGQAAKNKQFRRVA